MTWPLFQLLYQHPATQHGRARGHVPAARLSWATLPRRAAWRGPGKAEGSGARACRLLTVLQTLEALAPLGLGDEVGVADGLVDVVLLALGGGEPLGGRALQRGQAVLDPSAGDTDNALMGERQLRHPGCTRACQGLAQRGDSGGLRLEEQRRGEGKSGPRCPREAV